MELNKFTETSVLYPLVAKMFDAGEICDLREVSIKNIMKYNLILLFFFKLKGVTFSNEKSGLMLSKRNQYTEMFKIS